MFKAYKDFWVRGTQFKGRSTRSQYWWAVLCNVIIELALTVLGIGLIAIGALRVYGSLTQGESSATLPLITIIFGAVLFIGGVVFSLVELVPRYSLLTRRFHDAGFSGWWIWAIIAFNAVVAFMVTVAVIHGFQGVSYVLMGNSPFSSTSFEHHIKMIEALNYIPAIFSFIVTILPKDYHKRAFLAQNRK